MVKNKLPEVIAGNKMKQYSNFVKTVINKKELKSFEGNSKPINLKGL